jgi:hypothetical protein
MPYSLRRPGSGSGVGGLTVYRAVSRVNQPLLQEPVRWTRQQGAFESLWEKSDPKDAALLARVGAPHIPKIWTEIAYEVVRSEVAPDHPSRLDSLFAFADPLEAFAFQQHVDAAVDVWEGQVLDGARWGLVDMAGFEVVQSHGSDMDSFANAWDQASAAARSYWAPGEMVETAEILVEGRIQLRRKLDLLPSLRELGALS